MSLIMSNVANLPSFKIYLIWNGEIKWNIVPLRYLIPPLKGDVIATIFDAITSNNPFKIKQIEKF